MPDTRSAVDRNLLLDMQINRRQLIASALAGAALGPRPAPACGTNARHKSSPLIGFVSAGQIGLIHADGSRERYLKPSVPDQQTWQPGPIFPDGDRMILLSMEARRDGPGRPFDQYYTQTPTRIWIYHVASDHLVEICHRKRMAPFTVPAALLGDERLLVQVAKPGMAQIWNVKLDGTDARPFTRIEDGFPYGISLSPNRTRVAFHTAGPAPHGYRVWTSDLEGGTRTLVAEQPGHLYFGPVWSPDGQGLAYHDCIPANDPGHDWSDVCVGRPDGSQHKVLTKGQPQWFGAAYGNPARKGSGSNMLSWTRNGEILITRRTPDAKVAWEFQTARPDVDHFNRDWKPERARGGTEIVKLSPGDGAMAPMTSSDPPRWDLRPSESATSRQIAFLRCATAEMPALWVVDPATGTPRELTRGLHEQGVDHPRWLEPA